MANEKMTVCRSYRHSHLLQYRSVPTAARVLPARVATRMKESSRDPGLLDHPGTLSGVGVHSWITF